MLAEAEELREPRLDEAPLLRVGDVLLERRAQLLEGRDGVVVLGDAAAHAHHVGERPVGDALAVGEAAASMPVRQLREAVEVLVELPGEPRLADPGDARHRDEVCLSLLGGGVEEILDLAELPVTPDERRLEPGRLERAARARDDPERLPQRHEPFLALQLVRARILVDDRLLGRAPRRLADVDRAGVGSRLHPRGRVDEVAGDHPLPLGADRHRRLASEDAGPGTELRRSHLVTERRDSGDEVERGAHGALGVVLGRGRRAPDCHHRVADELLDRAAVEADQPAAGVEVAGEKLANLLRVARLRERREAHQVGEEDRDQAALRDRALTRRCRRETGPDLGGGRSTTLAAELLVAHESGAA